MFSASRFKKKIGLKVETDNIDDYKRGIKAKYGDNEKVSESIPSESVLISDSSKESSKEELKEKNPSSESISSTSLDEPISPRKLSNKLKFTPSHYVRNSIYSENFGLGFNNSNVKSKNKNSFTNLMNETNKVPPELSPILTLFNCHNFRHYCNGFFDIKIGEQWVGVEAKLTGNELAIWSNDEFNPKYFNLFDYNINYDLENLVIKFSNDFNENFYNLIIKLNDYQDFVKWLANFYLSNFERISLNESFTAVTLSLIGSKLSDIHTLLSKKKYPKSDWYNIRLPQVNHKWLKVFIIVNPSTSKKDGNIEIYVNDKLGKKNLVGYISSLTNIYNIFPENPNMIEYNSIMKLNGEVFINRDFEHLFDETFHEDVKVTPPPGYNGHRRTTSQSSFFSVSSSPPSTPKIKSSSRFIRTNYIYLMPNHHPGVQEIETMIRNLIPIMDCFKLYGRPKQLISDKLHKDSLLFGLPSLPHYQYLPSEEIYALLELFLKDSISENWSFDDWYKQIKTVLEYKSNNEDYRGSGNILDLYKSLELDDDDIRSIKSVPSINLPESAYPDSPTTPQRSPSGFEDRFSTPNNLDSTLNSPKSVHSFKFENFENLNNIELKSPVQSLGRFDE
ncbi:hypothetical protein CLIB1444_08S03554 [[Candida] jaroonii]|uniref:Uncharacterized protein n=1 Tax=[Candida] jaroonii TaxID=467808 RepID=A0ACA9YBV4_9ASCO|nr:hypothetical protein CLIB1444_08S03554 [[Candida] jaroonii]